MFLVRLELPRALDISDIWCEQLATFSGETAARRSQAASAEGDLENSVPLTSDEEVAEMLEQLALAKDLQVE